MVKVIAAALLAYGGLTNVKLLRVRKSGEDVVDDVRLPSSMDPSDVIARNG